MRNKRAHLPHYPNYCLALFPGVSLRDHLNDHLVNGAFPSVYSSRPSSCILRNDRRDGSLYPVGNSAWRWLKRKQWPYKFSMRSENSARTPPAIQSECDSLRRPDRHGQNCSPIIFFFFFFFISATQNPYRVHVSPVSALSQTALLPRPINSLSDGNWLSSKADTSRSSRFVSIWPGFSLSFFALPHRTATVSVRIRWTAWYLPATVRSARIRETSRRTPRVRPCSARWNRVSARNVANPAARNGS